MAKEKNNDIVIENFQAGIADSDLMGFAAMNLVDISTIPGAAQINFATTKQSGTVFTGSPRWLVQDSTNGGTYAMDENAVVYKCVSGTWSVLTGNGSGGVYLSSGLCIWKDYLFAFRNTNVDVYGPLSGTPAWTNSFGPAYTGSEFHPALWGQDDILYWGAGTTVCSIQEVAGKTFSPSDSTTYIIATPALSLPAYSQVTCLAELGQNLMVGTKRLRDTTSSACEIYPWDRISASFTLPIKVWDAGIKQMITVNNTLYFVAGNLGTLYSFNGYYVQLLKQLYKVMQHGSTQQATYGAVKLEFYPGAIIYNKNKLYFGVSSLGSSYVGPLGVWSFDIATGTLAFENQISTGQVIPATKLLIGALLNNAGTVYIGWEDATVSAYGVDVPATTRYSSYSAYIDSALYHVGEPEAKREMDRVIINLTQPLQSGQGVKVQYRTGRWQSWTAAHDDALDYATFGAIQSKSFPFNSPVSLENLQVRILLTTTDNTSPVLQSITLR